MSEASIIIAEYDRHLTKVRNELASVKEKNEKLTHLVDFDTRSILEIQSELDEYRELVHNLQGFVIEPGLAARVNRLAKGTDGKCLIASVS